MKNWLLFTLILMVFSCGKDKKNNSEPITFIDPKEVAEMDILAAGIKLEAGVPEYLGQIVSLTEDDSTPFNDDIISACTGNLIASNRIITNKHCIHGRFTEADFCREHFRIIFRQGENHYIGHCKKMLASSETAGDTLSDQDYAIIELEENIPITPVEIDTNGIEDATPIIINSVDLFTIGLDEYESRLRRSECQSAFNDVFDHYLKTDQVITMVGKDSFTKCDVIKGNSGSAMINRNTGKAIGLAQSIIEVGETPAEEVHERVFKSMLTQSEKVVFGTSLTSINFLNPDYLAPTTEESALAEARLDWKNTSLYLKSTFFSLPKYHRAIDIFDYEFTTADEDLIDSIINSSAITSVVQPKCILKWLKENELPDSLVVAASELEDSVISFDYRLSVEISSSQMANVYGESEALLGTDQDGVFYEFNSPTASQSLPVKIRYCSDED